MCGIAGFTLGANPADAAVAERVGATLAHRGPDDGGSFLINGSNLALVHRRLAVIDLTEHGRQPMTSRSGRWVISYNGEIYNHRSLRRDLEGAGTSFRGSSDTETLVEAIDAWGFETALRRTNGMFALAAFDNHTQHVFLARDRLGEKPLYWVHDGDRVAFASELRALRALPGVDLTIDRRAAAALLRWSFIPHPHTIYRGVNQLEPGALVEVSLGSGAPTVRTRRWWSLSSTIADAIDRRRVTTLDEAAEELEALIADAVALRLESDVPLGTFLSGGIDSSLVSALAQRVTSADVRTFTVSMPEAGFDESAHARVVAQHLGTEHTEVHLSMTDAVAMIPRLPQIWDEPFADPSMLPTALLCGAARRELTVCLSGDGGDELFAGYNRHAVGARLHQRFARIPRPVRRGLGRLALVPSPSLIDRVGARLPGMKRLPNPGDKVQKAAALLTADAGTEGLGAWEVLAGIWPADDLGSSPYLPSHPDGIDSLDAVEQMMAVDTSAVLPDQMLTKVDRGSMAASLEVRVPLLDHRILEWSWAQHTAVKTAGGVGKLVLRRIADRLLPPEIVTRPKMGFDPPLPEWLRGDLRGWAGDLLDRPRSVDDGLVDGAALRSIWNEHQSGRRNWDYRLWAILMYEAWVNEHHPAPDTNG